MVELLQISCEGATACIVTFRMNDVPPERRAQVASMMEVMGCIQADGQVTMEEAAQLLALAYPDLAGSQLAPVLEAADEAVKALRDDGKVSLPEACGILYALMAGVPSLRELSDSARSVAARMLGLRK